MLITDAASANDHSNARVSGWGAWQRVVLYDTLVNESKSEDPSMRRLEVSTN